MAAVAVRDNLIRREDTANSRTVTPVRRVKRRASRTRKLARRLLIPIVMLAAFLYVGLYASVTATSYEKSRLIDLCRREQIRNERLTVELVRRSSPRYVTEAAQKTGMVCATRYEYLRKSATVASAGNGE